MKDLVYEAQRIVDNYADHKIKLKIKIINNQIQYQWKDDNSNKSNKFNWFHNWMIIAYSVAIYGISMIIFTNLMKVIT